jgi:hypothetical protein
VLAGLHFAHAQAPAARELNYEDWVRQYSGWRGGLEPEARSPGPLLTITAVEGDDQPPRPDGFSTETAHGNQVSKEGNVTEFFHSSMGSKGGGGGPPLAEPVLKRLDELLAALPDDEKRLPPKGRRLLVRGAMGEKSVTRVYDRANAPAPVWEMLRLIGSRLGAYVPQFQPKSEIDARGFQHDGFLALAPDGKQLLFTGMNQPLQFWSPASHELLAEVRGLGSRHIAFSPDGTQAVIVDSMGSALVETRTWTSTHKLEAYFEPRYLPDGRHVVMGGGVKPLQIYETATGARVAQLPEIPEGAVKYLPAPKSRRAVVQLVDGKVELWNPAENRAIATLRESDRLAEAVFSPDESLVATATYSLPPARQVTSFDIWRTDTGALVHELRPFEQVGREQTAGLLWSPDGEYVLAGAFPDLSSNNIVCVFSAKTGRHRGQFAAPELWRLNGVVLLPDGSELVAGDSGGKIRFWDFQAAMKSIREFEKTLAPSAPP